jgi:hypothetical protein
VIPWRSSRWCPVSSQCRWIDDAPEMPRAFQGCTEPPAACDLVAVARVCWPCTWRRYSAGVAGQRPRAIARASSTSNTYTVQRGGYRQAPRTGQAPWLRGLRNASADAVAHLLRMEVGQQSGPAQSTPQDVGARGIRGIGRGRGNPRYFLRAVTELAMFRSGVIANASLAAVLPINTPVNTPGVAWLVVQAATAVGSASEPNANERHSR